MIKLLKKYESFPVPMKASLWFLICAFLQKGITMLTTPVFTRILSTEEYGRFNIFFSWSGIITIFVSLNLSYGVYTQGLIKFDKDRDRFSSSLQGLSTTLIFIWTIIYIVFRDFWNNVFKLTTVQMLAMLVMIWTTAVFSFWASEQRVLYKYHFLVGLSLAVSVAKPLLGICFVNYAIDKVTARILSLLLVELMAYSGLYMAQMLRGKKFFYFKYWRYALIFNLLLIPHYLSQTVLNNSDRIMISKMVGDSEAGIYSLAYSLANIMTLFNNALLQTINPWIYKKIKDKKIIDISSIAYISLCIIAIVNLALIIFAPEVVAIFAPRSYYDAIWIIPPVAMSVYFMFSYDMFAKFAFYYEKTRMIMLASAIGAILNIILNYIFINIFGYRAAGYTTLFCYMIYSVGHYIFMNKVCDSFCDGVRPYKFKIVLCITIPFLFMGFLILLTYKYIIIRYLLICIVTSIMICKRKMAKEIIDKLIFLKHL